MSFDRLGQRLGEGELGLEAARRQIGVVVKLARVGDPLVDQHQAGPILVEQHPERVTGIGRPLVVGAHPLERLLAAELPGELPPQGAHHRAVPFWVRVSRGNTGADQHHAPHLRGDLDPGLRQYLVHAGEFPRGDPGEQVVKRQH